MPSETSTQAGDRFVLNLGAAVAAALTSVAVARTLGTEGKGVVSMLSFLVAAIGGAASVSLGDAAVALSRRRPEMLQGAAQATMGATLLFSVPAVCVFLLIAVWQVGLTAATSPASFLFAAVAVVPFAVHRNLVRLLEGSRGIRAAGVAHFLMAATTAALTLALVSALRSGIPGALFALAAGPIVSVLYLRERLDSRGITLEPRLERRYLKRALRVGIPMESSQLMQTLSSRLDVAIVFALSGPSITGLYGVALTVGEAVRFAPAAIATAAFPLVAQTDPRQQDERIGDALRIAAILGVSGAALLAFPARPMVVGLFGEGFSAAVTPTRILLAAGAIESVRLVLCRAIAAKGQTGPLVASYTTSLLLMIALDLLLVPRWGATGAALASLGGTVVGAGVAATMVNRSRAVHVGVRQLLPRSSDLERIYSVARIFVRRLRP